MDRLPGPGAFAPKGIGEEHGEGEGAEVDGEQPAAQVSMRFMMPLHELGCKSKAEDAVGPDGQPHGHVAGISRGLTHDANDLDFR